MSLGSSGERSGSASTRLLSSLPPPSDPSGLISHATSSSMEETMSQVLMSPILPSSRVDTSYRSAESNDFLHRCILGGNLGSVGQSVANPFDEDVESAEEDEELDQEQVDIDTYTLHVRGEIVNWFADAAGRLNELIDERDAIANITPQDEQRIDAEVEVRVEENKAAFQSTVKPKIVEYLALIQESIRALQREEEELLNYCSSMYQRTCE